MKKYKILDFDYTCGGFTNGLENLKRFEVIYNGCITKKNKYTYNGVHERNFSEKDEMPSEDVDLVVFNPYFGDNLRKYNPDNFRKTTLNNFLALISLHDFDNIIFTTQREVYPYLQYSNEISYTFDGKPTKDIICYFLNKLNYNVFYFIIDISGFGIPQEKYYGIYWASKVFDESIEVEERYGFFKDKKYLTTMDFLGGLGDNTNISWHEPDYTRKKECFYVLPGSNAFKTPELTQSKGFYRLHPDKRAFSLSPLFYRVSDRGPSIHPKFHRPLTIREGACLFGIPFEFDWDKSLNKKEVGNMLYNSFSPIVSEKLGVKLLQLFDKKNE